LSIDLSTLPLPETFAQEESLLILTTIVKHGTQQLRFFFEIILFLQKILAECQKFDKIDAMTGKLYLIREK
jgi:hypothetical protein